MKKLPLRQRIRQQILMPPGPLMHKPQESLAFMASGDEEYQNKHLLQDMVDTLGTAAYVHEKFEQATDGQSEVEVRDYFRQLTGNDDFQSSSDDRVASGDIILLARNTKLVLEAYIRLGGEEKLGHAEEMKLRERISHAPKLLLKVAKHFKQQAVESEHDREAVAYFIGLKNYAEAMKIIISSQLREPDGFGRSGANN